MRGEAIKAAFSRAYLCGGSGAEAADSGGKLSEGRGGVWQARYAEHTIRDEQGLIAHAEYIHYNPVKQGYVRCQREWPWSSFRRHMTSADWACGNGSPPIFPGVCEEFVGGTFDGDERTKAERETVKINLDHKS